ncbi:MAG: hypothetical protein HQM03_13750 [Magnetococcales bacterium]|nr:hypothetical protein [Magnetococcales bacterium]
MTETSELAKLANAQIHAGEVDLERLHAIRDLILVDRVIDDHEVDIMRRMILSTRPKTSHAVKRAEIEILFELNEATMGKRNDEKWKAFFIEAITLHLLNDDVSSGIVDEAEAHWLIQMIERDSQYDANEIALLEHIQATAKEIPMSVKFRLGLILAINL